MAARKSKKKKATTTRKIKYNSVAQMSGNDRFASMGKAYMANRTKTRSYGEPQRRKSMLQDRRDTCGNMTPKKYPTRGGFSYATDKKSQSYTCSAYKKRGPRGPRASRATQGSSLSKQQMSDLQREYDEMQAGSNRRRQTPRMPKARKKDNSPRIKGDLPGCLLSNSSTCSYCRRCVDVDGN